LARRDRRRRTVRIGQPARHARPVAFEQKDHIQQPVIGRRGERDGQRGSGAAEIENLDEQEIAGEYFAVDADLETLRLSLLHHCLQPLSTHIYAERLRRLASAVGDGLGDGSESDRLDKATLPPGTASKPDIEASRLRGMQAWNKRLDVIFKPH